jgi:hypothetical protein
MTYKTRTPVRAGIDPEFVAEVEQRCHTAISLARAGAIRGSVVLHLLEDGSLYGYSFGEMPPDLRELAAKIGSLS